MDEEFNLEKMKINERLALIEQKFSCMDEKVDVIYKNIVGNGELGLKTKVDRLEMAEKDRKESHNRLWTATIGVIISLVGKIGWDIFKK